MKQTCSHPLLNVFRYLRLLHPDAVCYVKRAKSVRTILNMNCRHNDLISTLDDAVEFLKQNDLERTQEE